MLKSMEVGGGGISEYGLIVIIGRGGWGGDQNVISLNED